VGGTGHSGLISRWPHELLWLCYIALKLTCPEIPLSSILERHWPRSKAIHS
jgi:hypothetical protein